MGFRITRLRLLLLPAVAVAFLTAVLLPSGPAASPVAETAATKRVSVRDDVFTPRTARIGLGDRVKWSWKGDNPHNVTFRKVPKGASKRRARTRSTGSFTRSFTNRGTYRYVCTIHEDIDMKGTVVAG